MAVKRVPDGFHRVSPHLTVRDAAAMIEFYKKAFGAVEKRRALGPDGKLIMHAEIQIGDSIVFLNDEFPDMGALSPLASGSTSVTLHLYVEDADKQFQQALSIRRRGCNASRRPVLGRSIRYCEGSVWTPMVDSHP